MVAYFFVKYWEWIGFYSRVTHRAEREGWIPKPECVTTMGFAAPQN